MVIAYGGKATDQLNQMRYQTYCVFAASAQGDLKPEKLPQWSFDSHTVLRVCTV